MFKFKITYFVNTVQTVRAESPQLCASCCAAACDTAGTAAADVSLLLHSSVPYNYSTNMCVDFLYFHSSK